MSTTQHDAIVVGAGPAGLTAARDLGDQGYSVLVLEGRDRVGGRTYTRTLQGYDDVTIEVGGTYIHPDLQHNLGREIRRYDQPLTEGLGDVRSVGFHVDGQLRMMPVPPGEILALERAILAMADAAQRIRTHIDLSDQYLSDLDVSIEEFLAPLRLPETTRQVIYGGFAGIAQCDVHQVSMLQWLSWIAGLGSPVSLFFGVTEEKLRDGTGALWRAMAEDAKAEIAYDVDVNRIVQERSRVSVTAAGGESFSARVCVVAVGSQVLDRIEFFPLFDKDRADLISGAYVAHGFKDFLVVENAPPDFLGFGGVGSAQTPRVGWLFQDRQLPDGRTLLVAWGCGERLATVANAQAALADYLPGAVVKAVDGHDWSADKYANGINHFHRPGEALRFASVVGKPHGDVFFATSEVTPGIWSGWMEGAVDSGGIAAVQAGARLRSARA